MESEAYRPRYLEQRLPSRDERRLLLITGARQTGKTTIATNQYASLNYLNLDAPEIRETIRNLSTYDWVNTVGVAILDEVQKEPIALEKMKFCFDNKTLPFSVLLGSSQLMLLKKVRESLAGRISLYELFPFMLSELIGRQPPSPPLIDQLLKSSSIDHVFANLPKVLFGEQAHAHLSAHHYLLKWGGMPALFSITKDEERRKWLKDYEYTYLERDLIDLARMHDLDPFRKFQSLAALRSGNLLSYSELARDASISVDTARRYFEYLRLSYQAFFLPPYFSNATTSLIKTPKLYWLDIGILRQATHHWGDVTGSLFETMVVSELYKWIKSSEQDYPLSFYRTHGGLECDLLIETEQGFLGIEVKHRERVYPKDFSALRQIKKRFPSQWIGSLVVYNGSSIEKLPDDQCWAIPSWRLFS